MGDSQVRIINLVSNSTCLIIGGDVNAKTGSSFEQYRCNMGKFGKGITNENGEYLLDFENTNQLFLTNTMFNHKMADRATWVRPERMKI